MRLLKTKAPSTQPKSYLDVVKNLNVAINNEDKVILQSNKNSQIKTSLKPINKASTSKSLNKNKIQNKGNNQSNLQIDEIEKELIDELMESDKIGNETNSKAATDILKDKEDVDSLINNEILSVQESNSDVILPKCNKNSSNILTSQNDKLNIDELNFDECFSSVMKKNITTSKGRIKKSENSNELNVDRSKKLCDSSKIDNETSSNAKKDKDNVNLINNKNSNEEGSKSDVILSKSSSKKLKNQNKKQNVSKINIDKSSSKVMKKNIDDPLNGKIKKYVNSNDSKKNKSNLHKSKEITLSKSNDNTKNSKKRSRLIEDSSSDDDNTIFELKNNNSNKSSCENNKSKITKTKACFTKFFEDGVFVYCDDCHKFRQLKYIKYPDDVPERWICDMHESKSLTCDEPEEDFSHYFEYFINNKFTLGSVVWAKLPGFDWWPGIVDSDPDIEVFYWCYEDSDEVSHYHVTFLDKNVSRSWILARDIRPFKNKNEFIDDHLKLSKNKNTIHKMKEACENADECLKLTLEERIHKFGFMHRYNGKPNLWTRKGTLGLNFDPNTCGASFDYGGSFKKPKCTKVSPKDKIIVKQEKLNLEKAASLLEEESSQLLSQHSISIKHYDDDDSQNDSTMEE